jgi:hypothetical protein
MAGRVWPRPDVVLSESALSASGYLSVTCRCNRRLLAGATVTRINGFVLTVEQHIREYWLPSLTMPCAHKKCIHGRDKRYCKLGCKDLILPRKPRTPKTDPRFPNVAGVAKPQYSKVAIPTAARNNLSPITKDALIVKPNNAANIHRIQFQNHQTAVKLELDSPFKDFATAQPPWKTEKNPSIQEKLMIDHASLRQPVQSDVAMQNSAVDSVSGSISRATDQPPRRNSELAACIVDAGPKFTQPQDFIAPRMIILRTTTKQLSNLCCAKPTPAFDTLRPAIPTLADIIRTSQDDQVLADVCAALCCLSNGMSDQIQVLLDAGVARHLVLLLRHELFEVDSLKVL